MSFQTLAIAVVTVVYFVIRYLNRTDVPKIKGLPEIPGVPLFGNLLQLGDKHATVTAKWAKKLGPVFQVRMGNKVRYSQRDESERQLTRDSALSLPIASIQCANCGLRTSQL